MQGPGGRRGGALVGRCWLTPVETRVESACCQRLKLKDDELLSHCAVNFSLSLFTLAGAADVEHAPPVRELRQCRRRRQRLPRRRLRRRWGRAVQVDPIKPTLKAPGT